MPRHIKKLATASIDKTNNRIILGLSSDEDEVIELAFAPARLSECLSQAVTALNQFNADTGANTGSFETIASLEPISCSVVPAIIDQKVLLCLQTPDGLNYNFALPAHDIAALVQEIDAAATQCIEQQPKVRN